MKKAENVQIETLTCGDDGAIPNHPYYPLLLYRSVIEAQDNPKEILTSNNWLGIWEDGIFPYHHYHSNSHEVLAVTSGSALVQFGGEKGHEFQLKEGDVAILPAGFGHKRLDCSSDFSVVGAYPNGRDYDICYGSEDERPWNLDHINAVPLPNNDPIFGSSGLLFDYWKD